MYFAYEFKQVNLKNEITGNRFIVFSHMPLTCCLAKSKVRYSSIVCHILCYYNYTISVSS